MMRAWRLALTPDEPSPNDVQMALSCLFRRTGACTCRISAFLSCNEIGLAAEVDVDGVILSCGLGDWKGAPDPSLPVVQMRQTADDALSLKMNAGFRLVSTGFGL